MQGLGANNMAVWLWLSRISPIIKTHIHRLGKRGGHLNKRASIAAAKFNYRQTVRLILSQTICDRRPSRATANNDVVKFILVIGRGFLCWIWHPVTDLALGLKRSRPHEKIAAYKARILIKNAQAFWCAH